MPATWLDLARRIVGDRPDRELDHLLWEHTPFPCCSVLETARWLRRWKREEEKAKEPTCE